MDPFLLHHGDCLAWLRTLPDNDVDHVIVDPPYSPTVHGKSRSGRNLPDAEGGEDFNCKARRAIDFGFEAITPDQIQELSKEYARLAKRWILIFSDVESSHLWRAALAENGSEYVRTGAWVKLRGTPQFTGDRPGTGFEAITIAHRKGRKRWNGGGKVGVWTHAVVANCNGHRQDRVHTTQKPISLMVELVTDFTDPGDRILDSHMGSGTTGVAAVRLGRRFVGCEIQPRNDTEPDYFGIARDRLQAELTDSDLTAMRNGQVPLFTKAG